MNETSSLPLYAQKAVLGRLLGFQALAPQLSLLESRGCLEAGGWLTACICRSTDTALGDVDNREPLVSFLERLVAELEAEAEKLPRDVNDTVGGILQELAELVGAFGKSHEDPLWQLITAVAQTAAGFYHAFGMAVPDEPWERVQPVISFLGGDASLSFAPTIHLQVSTKFGMKDTQSAEVCLKIAPRWLDPETIAALPRVLLHEYISHVSQGPYQDERAHPGPEDGFAEGWMDYVAHCVHRAVLQRRGPSNPLADYLALTWLGFYEATAERFFSARSALRGYDPAAAARSEGAKAARQLHDLLRGLKETSDNPDEALYRFSFGLNVSGLSSVHRRLMVAQIRRCLLRASRSDALVPLLRQWAAGRIELEDLAASLLG